MATISLDHVYGKKRTGGKRDRTATRFRRGSLILYSSSFIDDLAGNYFVREEAMGLLRMPRATRFAWTKDAGVEFIRIGQVSLFRKDVVLAKRRAG